MLTFVPIPNTEGLEVAREVEAVLKTWADELPLLAQVQQLALTLTKKFAVVGFEAVPFVQIGAKYQEATGFLEAWTWRRFRHPDSEVPFAVKLSLLVYARKDRLGQVSVDMSLLDVIPRQGTPGVLYQKPFSGNEQAVAGKPVDSLMAWQSHVQEGLRSYLAREDKELIDLAAAHVESCACV